MTNAQDLHIEEEIRPLFDFTYNINSGKEVSDILSKTLSSKEEILFRQQLLKGFIANWEILKAYSLAGLIYQTYMIFLKPFLSGLLQQGNYG